MPDITVLIPTLPERAHLLERALRSVDAQTLQPADVLVRVDRQREGIAATRNRLLKLVSTPLVAFLDDDDEMLPHHLELLAKEMDSSGADLVWPDMEVVGAPDHRPTWIQVTYLARTDLIRQVGGFPEPFSDEFPYRYEDWGLLARLTMAGARFHHVPQITWRYYIHDSNIVGTGF
jgi:glycosyltransferase involved in cell wall biosynthesis